MDSGRAISFGTLGTRDLPTLRSFGARGAGPSATAVTTGGAFGVDQVELRPGAASRWLRVVQFDDQLTGVGQVAAKARAVAASALHRPGRQPRPPLGQAANSA